jgi:hypothetical protein
MEFKIFMVVQLGEMLDMLGILVLLLGVAT